MRISEMALKLYQHYLDVYGSTAGYYGLVASYGMVLVAEKEGFDSEVGRAIREELDRFPDGVTHPHYNFQNYRIGGNAKARAIWNGMFQGEKYDAQLREYAEELMHAPRNCNGIVSHPLEGYHDWVWIDIATAVTNFLLFAGLHFQEERYLNEAAFQTLEMYRFFRDQNCGLLNQFHGKRGLVYRSQDHWSRGNGWGIFPLAELCALLPEENPHRQECIEVYKEHLEALMKYRSQRGLWRQEITLESLDGLESVEETSGTGLIYYAMGLGIKAGILDRASWMPILEEGVRSLVAYAVNEDFSVDHCCPGMCCPGEGREQGSIKAYLEAYREVRDEHHAAGPVIMALMAANACGMEEL